MTATENATIATTTSSDNRKRLETVDGVEIASSYKEYLDLALGDLRDRLVQSSAKLGDVEQRAIKRRVLLRRIDVEMRRRNAFTRNLTAQDKRLRAHLLRNTEMRAAMQNLALIAGYRLQEEEKAAANLTAHSANDASNNTYTRYIQMAYDEVDTLLSADKQTLVEIIRRLKNNDAKLKELEQLRTRVNESLLRLNEFALKLRSMIGHDAQIASTVTQLEQQQQHFEQTDTTSTSTPSLTAVIN